MVEWTYHKTGDNLHPDGNEQQLVWLMNRARSDPAREGQWLAAMTDPDVAGARSYFKVDLSVLSQEFAAIGSKPPAAFDIRLYQAAGDHSAYLIAADVQSHDGQLARVNSAGFRWTQYRGNVFSYSGQGRIFRGDRGRRRLCHTGHGGGTLHGDVFGG
jgi:hypothetical protein